MADRIGHQVGNYRLLRLLGTGGFAEVYLGEHAQLGTLAAIKLLHASLMNEHELMRFHQEARIIAHLTHPNIVRVLDFDAQGGMPYLVMDYASEGSLRQQYPAGTILPLSHILAYVVQIAQGLQYAHAHKVVHRDIKPQNLLLGPHDEVLLTDFGISIITETTSRQQSQTFAGTAVYAAPEQVQGHPGPESDQYALAMIAYEWLTGTPAFTGSIMEVMWKQVHTPPPPLRSKVSTIPGAVEQVILKALAKDPGSRYPTIQAFADALVYASTRGSVDSTIPVPSQARPPGSSSGGEVASPVPSPPTPMFTPPSPLASQTEPQSPPFPGSAPWGKQHLLRKMIGVLLVAFVIGASLTAYILLQPHSQAHTGSQVIVDTATTTPTATPPLLGINTLTDDFNSGSVPDKTKWQLYTTHNATVTVSGGQLVATPEKNIISQAAASSVKLYSAIGESAFIQVLVSPSSKVHTAFGLQNAQGNNAIQIYYSAGKLVVSMYTGSTLFETPYDATTQQWWRIRENKGTTSIDISSDGRRWETLYAHADFFDMSQVRVFMIADEWAADPAVGSARFDNFNLNQG